MPIVYDAFNSLYVGGRKGKRFTINYCPKDINCPWSVQYRGAGHYFESLRELLAYCAGRGWIDVHSIKQYQVEIMGILDRKRNE